MSDAAAVHPSQEELAAFGVGRLGAAAAAAVAAHLEGCPACRRALEGLPPDSFLGKVRAARPGGPSLPPAPPPAPAGGATGLPAELAGYTKYRFERELGRGGMGVVYQAVQTLMGRPVAVKVINPAVLAHPDALPRFRAEVRAAAKLDRPHIVHAYDAEQVGGLHLLVMEFVEGTSLAGLVQRKGPLPVAHACHYARQAALGLQHAFEQGMVHRDVKPSNLMVSPRGVVKVLDFGLARLRTERARGGGLTQADSFMGTPEYVAPEQATDARSADIRADIYSLGCTLYFLLTGHPPFEEGTAVKLVLAHIEKEPTPLHEVRPDVPAGLSAVVARMLAKDPARRHQTPVEVAQALAAFVRPGARREAGGGPTPVPAVGSPSRGTVIAADTSQIKKVLREVPGTAPPKGVPAKEAGSPFADLVDTSAPPRKAKGARGATKRVPAGWYRRWPVLAGVGVLLLALLGMWAGGVFRVKTPYGTIVLENLPPDADVLVDGGAVTIKPSDGKTFEVRVDPRKKHRLEVKREGLTVFGEEVEVETGGRKSVLVRLEPARVDPDRGGDSRNTRGDRKSEGAEDWRKSVADLPPPKKEAVLGKGRTVVLGVRAWKVEGNRLGGLDGADVWWEQVSDTERNLVPLGGAAWAVLKGKPFEKVNREDLAGAAYSTGKLSGALLRPGTVVALRTRDGRYAKLKVVRYRALYDFSFPEAGHLPDRWRRFALSKPDVAEYHLEVSWVLYGGKE